MHTSFTSEQLLFFAVDTTWINGECLCNKFNGYYGNDINNCQLDTKHCKEAGYELDNDGKFISVCFCLLIRIIDYRWSSKQD